MSEYLNWFEGPFTRWRNHADGLEVEEREFQQQDCYDAEHEYFWSFGWKKGALPNSDELSLIEVSAFLDKIQKYAWFKRKFQRGKHRPTQPITLKTHNGSTSYGCWGTGEIDLSFHSNQKKFQKWIVVHELAHVLTPHSAGGAHGRYFARVYLELVRHVYGEKHAKGLAESFKKHGVKFNPRRILTPERKEQLKKDFVARFVLPKEPK